MDVHLKCMDFPAGLKSRRARQIIPAQDVDVGKLMEKFGMDSDSEESVDEDFSPTNADSGGQYRLIVCLHGFNPFLIRKW